MSDIQQDVHVVEDGFVHLRRRIYFWLGVAAAVAVAAIIGCVAFASLAFSNAAKIDDLSSALNDVRSQVVDCSKRPANDPRCATPVSPKAEEIAPPKETRTVLADDGKDGQPGPQGEQGPRGLQGLLGLQGLQGAQGPRGLTGLTGATGETGAQGVQGIQGLQGEPGLRGFTGLPGTNGKDGINGVDGKNGADGKDGADGAKGDKGDKGEKGDPVTLPRFVTGFTQGGDCSVTFFFSDNTDESIDLCEGD